jgi:[ribosomal protein S5]-alanine N-acetyltransferase
MPTDHFNFSPFPKLETGRLTLRELVLEDEEALFKLRSDDRVLEFLEITKAQNRVDSRKFIETIIRLVENNESVMWAITQKDEDELIGTICFWNISADGQEAEIGYMLSPEFQGQGIMRESMIAVIDYGFTSMKLKSIAAEVHQKNIRSVKLLEKEGFIYKKIEEEMAHYHLSNKTND